MERLAELKVMLESEKGFDPEAFGIEEASGEDEDFGQVSLEGSVGSGADFGGGQDGGTAGREACLSGETLEKESGLLVFVKERNDLELGAEGPGMNGDRWHVIVSVFIGGNSVRADGQAGPGIERSAVGGAEKVTLARDATGAAGALRIDLVRHGRARDGNHRKVVAGWDGCKAKQIVESVKTEGGWAGRRVGRNGWGDPDGLALGVILPGGNGWVSEIAPGANEKAAAGGADLIEVVCGDGRGAEPHF